jgi:hypothetical protein
VFSCEAGTELGAISGRSSYIQTNKSWFYRTSCWFIVIFMRSGSSNLFVVNFYMT